MDAERIRELEPMLYDYLGRFGDCFRRRDTQLHFPVYVRGQLSDLHRKSVEPMALAAGVPVHTAGVSDAFGVGRRPHGESIGLIDETGWVKKGDRTPDVQRQYCGSVGKQENSIITVHLGYAAGDFHCLVEGDLYLPKSWHEDRERCRRAGIPDEVVYRAKTDIASMHQSP